MQKHHSNFIKNRITDSHNRNDSYFLFVNATTENEKLPIIIKGEAIKWYYYKGEIDTFIPAYVDTLTNILNRTDRAMHVKSEDINEVGDRVYKLDYDKMLKINNPYLVKQKYVDNFNYDDSSKITINELNAAIAYLIDNNFKVETSCITGFFVVSDSADVR